MDLISPSTALISMPAYTHLGSTSISLMDSFIASLRGYQFLKHEELHFLLSGMTFILRLQSFKVALKDLRQTPQSSRCQMDDSCFFRVFLPWLQLLCYSSQQTICLWQRKHHTVCQLLRFFS